MSSTAEQAVAAAFRESWGQIVATLIGATGDWDLAEESAQDAFHGRAGDLVPARRPGPPGRVAYVGGAQPRHRRTATAGTRRRKAEGGGRD